MTTARRQHICLTETSYYHCFSRCVRRAFLCGVDAVSGKSNEHRRGWVERQILAQPRAFCVEVAGYSIMSNHYHVVVKVNLDLAASLSAEAIVARWQQLYRLNPLMERFKAGNALTDAEKDNVATQIARMREVLTSISHFMGYMNQYIARKANIEDECTGRFWEGRFQSQALLDEIALLRCMVYAELNPVRAGLSRDPRQSEYTSIKRRLAGTGSDLLPFKPDNPEAPTDHHYHLPVHFDDYLELLDWSGQIVMGDKYRTISASAPPLIDRFNITPDFWQMAMQLPAHGHQKALGSDKHKKKYCQAIGQHWVWR